MVFPSTVVLLFLHLVVHGRKSLSLVSEIGLAGWFAHRIRVFFRSAFFSRHAFGDEHRRRLALPGPLLLPDVALLGAFSALGGDHVCRVLLLRNMVDPLCIDQVPLLRRWNSTV